MNKISRTLGAIALGWTIGSCGDSPTGPPPPPPPPTTDVVVLSATVASVVPAASVQLAATAKDRFGQVLQKSFAWSTSDAGKATVSSTGLVSGIAPGTATITAAVDGKSASSLVTVLDGGVVASTGATLTLAAGAVQIAVPANAVATTTDLFVAPSTAFANDPRVVKGTPFDFGPSGTTFATPVTLRVKYDPANLPAGTEESALKMHLSTTSGWQALQTSTVDTVTNIVSAQVSHFSTYAVLLPVAVTAVEIRGPPDKPISANATSLLVGQSEQLSTILTDAAGDTLSDRSVTWSTSNPSVAAISSSGLITTVTVGTATITATAGGVTSSIALTVTPVPVASVSVVLTPASITAVGTSQATATTLDANSGVLTGRVVAWTTSAPEVATVDATTGVITAVAPGTATITGTSEGKSGSAPITVTAAPVASVVVTPSSASVVAGSTQQLSVALTDAQARPLTGRTVTWTSNATTIATVSSTTGLVTAIGPGSAIITATSEGLTGTSAITVTPVPVATVNVSLLPTSVQVGQPSQAAATTLDATGQTLIGRTLSWTSSNTAIASVSTSGLVTTLAVGTASITATSEGKTGSAILTVTPVPVSAVSVAVAAASIQTGQTTEATATVTDAANNVLTGRSVLWTSSDASVATVSPTGTITAVHAGTVTIAATCEGKTGGATLTVVPVPVATVVVSLNPAAITTGQTAQATATTKDANGGALVDRAIAWSSSNSAVATVNQSGIVTPMSLGTAEIVAASEGKSGSATISVVPVPVASVSVALAPNSISAVETSQATATTLDAAGGTLAGRTVSWSSSAPQVASVDATTGVITGVAPGTATISASSEGRTGSAVLTVTPAPIATMTVTLGTTTISSVESTQATATLLDAKGRTLTGRTIAWSSNNTSIATVSSVGLVSAVAPGQVTITAISEGHAASAPLTVTAAPVASISVTLSASSITAVETTQANATLFDAKGRQLTDRAILWSSDAPGVATVSQSGVVTAVGAGTASITATSEGKTGSAALTVTAAPVAAVSVTLTNAAINAVETTQANVTLRDANGGTITGRVVTWSSGNTGVATVSQSGLVTAISPGTAVITAISEGHAGTATLSVSPAPVASVTVSLASSSISAVETTQAIAVVRDAKGRTLTDRAVSWTSDKVGVATVSASGLVTGVSAGTAVISAISEGSVGTASVTVQPAPVVTVSVALAASSITAVGTTQATATLQDAKGQTLTDRAITWSSSNSAVATVSQTGVVTGIASGTTQISATSEGKIGAATLTVTDAPVAAIVVTPPSANVTLGGSQQLSASVTDVQGRPLVGRIISWSSSASDIATVSATGLVTAVGLGSATISATSEGKSGASAITVLPVPIASVAVTLAPATITTAETAQATAVTKDANGGALLGRAIAWSSSNSAVATVNQSGIVTPVSIGTAQIVATSEGTTGSATISVISVPVASVSVSLQPNSISAVGTSQATATTRDANGGVLTGRSVSWSSSAPEVATVDAASGVVTAVAEGTAAITATSEGKIGSATITVTPAPVATVTVTLAQLSITTIATTQAAAVLQDSKGRTLSGRTVTWTSDNTTIATVSTTGTVTGVSPGAAHIIAASEGQSGNATITVTAAPVASINVTLAPSTINAVETSQATAVTLDGNGGTLSGRNVSWSSSNPSVASISATGVITALDAGTSTISATSEGKTGIATLTVTPAPVASATVTLASNSITAVETTQATVVLRDSKDRLLTGRLVAWTSSNTVVATVSATGLVTAATPGTVTISATSEGIGGSSSLTVTPAAVATVTVAPSSASILVAGSQQLTATLKDSQSRVLDGRSVSWSSSAAGVATVSVDGLVTGVGAGTATITATSEGQSGTSAITVTAIPVATVSVALTSTSVEAGQSTQATATLRDANGGVLSGRSVTWSSSNPGVATVSASGLVTTIAAGTANITATSEGKTGSAALTVTPVPVASVSVTLAPPSITTVETSQATAVTLDAGGLPLTGRSVAWSSSNTSVATVSQTGLVTPVAPGTASIIAASEGKSGSSVLTVTPAPVASVSVALASSSINAVQTTQATATLRDANGQILTGRSIAWNSDNNAVATVSNSGVVSGAAVGTANITATSEGKTGAAQLTVTQAPVATVNVSLLPSSVQVGQTSQATAATLDANGQTLTGRAVTWTSSNTAVATVSASGLVTTLAVGTASITATSEGKSGSATLTVIPVPVATVTVSPSSATINSASTQQLSAITKDAGGAVLSGRLITWATSDAAVATVSTTGLVTAVAPGTATITASSEGKSGSASITVVPVPVASVTVALTATSITAVGTSQASATTLDANGVPLSGRTVSWSSSNTAVASVSQTGLVTAVAAGSASIIATSEGQVGSAALTVTPAPVATVSVTPSAATLPVTTTQQLTVVLRDANGGVLSGRAVTWTSNAPTIASVSIDGLVTAVAVGSATITATSEGQTGTSAITTTPAPVATVSVSLSPTSITAVGTSQATATTLDANGATLTGRLVTWSTSAPAVATVDATTGVITAVAVGTATITGTSEGKSGSASITVTAAPVASVAVTLARTSMSAVDTTQATATLLDSKGRTLSGRLVTWTSSNTGVATISSTGLVIGVAPGTANIVASSEGQTGSAALTIGAAPVASVTVAPTTASIAAGFTQQLTAIVKDSRGTTLTGRTITWTSSSPSSATVSTTGLVTGVSTGTATITATSEGQTGTSSITVTPAPVASVTVSLNPTTITAVGTSQGAATLLDAQGRALTGRTVVWTSSNTAVATVSGSGLVSGVAIGTATISASSEGQIGGAVVTVTAAPVASVVVAPSSASVVAGNTQQLSVNLADAQGRPLTGRTVTWTSNATTIATVSSTTGLVTAIAPGSATIIATSEGITGTSAITVTPRPVATVSVSLAASTIQTNQTTQATATLLDDNNNVLTGRSVVWTSSAPSVATVSATGLVTPVAPGTANIVATSEGKAGSAALTVIPVPVASVNVTLAPSSITAVGTSQASAVTLDANGTALTGRAVTWSSANTAVATVDALTGVVNAVAPGTVSITGTSEGKSGSATLTVTAAPVATVTVNLASNTLTAVGTTQATAILVDAQGRTLSGRVVTWASSDDAIATVSSVGLVTAIATGTATITATSEGQSGGAVLTVTPAPVATVTVVPTSPSVTAGGTQQFTATLKDAQDRTLLGRTVTWTSSALGVATVSPTGLATALTPGTTTITATSEAQNGTASLTVTPVPVASVVVTPPTASVIVGGTQQLSAETRDAANNVLSGRDVTWTTNAPLIATVSSTGLVTTLAVGPATITATSEGQNGTSAITVIPVPVATVTVSLSPSTITAVGTAQATATTLDAGGATLTGRTITWTSGNTAVASVNATTGLVTAVAVGTAQITATSEGKNGSATLTVTQAPVDTVAVSLAQSSITAVGNTQATASLKDSQGRTLTGRSIVWASDNTAVAAVSPAGDVTGVSVGTAHITATSEGKTGSATLTVTQAPVATVTVSPTAPNISVGSSQQLSATLKDSQNRDLTGRTITWASSNSALATVVSTSGLVTAVAEGSATITATSEGVNGTSLVTVTAPATTATLLHHSTQNPRYFENASGQIVYLTGSHTWSNLQDNGTVDPPATFDYTKYLDFLAAHNHNFFRLWAWEQTKYTAEISADYWIAPNPFKRTGPGTAIDGKPKFDLGQFDQSYFDRLRSRVQDAGARGIYVSVMLFDGWSVGEKGGLTLNNPWKGHPFNGANNINGIDADTNGDGFGFESQTLGNPALAIQEAYVHKVIDAVGDLDNVLYEISNESDPSSRDWQYHMIQVIKDYENTTGKHHPIGMTAMWPGGSDTDLINSAADWISTGNAINLTAPEPTTGTKVLISDTDHICGICGTVDWVWKSFTKGHNPILMDGYDGAAIGLGAEDYDITDPKWEAIRKNMGYAREYAQRMDLAAAVPHGDLVAVVATGYCLAKPGSQYLVYIPSGGSVTLDLSAVVGTLNVEWLDPATGAKTLAGTTTGGASKTFTAPAAFSGSAVLFLH